MLAERGDEALLEQKLRTSYFFDDDIMQNFFHSIDNLGSLEYSSKTGATRECEKKGRRSVTYAYITIYKSQLDDYKAPERNLFRDEHDEFEVRDYEDRTEIAIGLAHLKTVERPLIIDIITSRLGLEKMPKNAYKGFVLFPIQTLDDLGEFECYSGILPGKEGLFVRMYWNPDTGVNPKHFYPAEKLKPGHT